MRLISKIKKSHLLVVIIILKIFASFFALEVFSKISDISDPFAYVSGAFQGPTLLNRTYLVGNIGAYLGRTFGLIAPHYMFSVFSGICLWLFLIELPFKMRPLIFIFSCLPSVTIWCGFVSKESLAVSALLLGLTAWVRIINGKFSLYTALLLLASLPLYGFIRPNYFVGLAYLVFGTILLKPKLKGKSISNISNGILVFLLTCLILLSIPSLMKGLDGVINLSLTYFKQSTFGTGRSNWLVWNDLSDYYKNMYWAIPFGVIGPLPKEVFIKFTYIPALLEGLLIFVIPILYFSLFKARFRRKPNPKTLFYYRLLFFVILPMTCYLYLIHSPLGIPNPGSAVRYRVGFEYLITLPGFVVSYFIYYLETIHHGNEPSTNEPSKIQRDEG